MAVYYKPINQRRRRRCRRGGSVAGVFHCCAHRLHGVRLQARVHRPIDDVKAVVRQLPDNQVRDRPNADPSAERTYRRSRSVFDRAAQRVAIAKASLKAGLHRAAGENPNLKLADAKTYPPISNLSAPSKLLQCLSAAWSSRCTQIVARPEATDRLDARTAECIAIPSVIGCGRIASS